MKCNKVTLGITTTVPLTFFQVQLPVSFPIFSPPLTSQFILLQNLPPFQASDNALQANPEDIFCAYLTCFFFLQLTFIFHHQSS